MLQKRQKVDSLKKFYDKQQQSAAMDEMLQKMLVQSKTKFEDVGGMKETKKQLREMIEWPIEHKDIFNKLGVSPPKGILISGPPGSGKTLLAMAVAGSNPDIPFYRISGPEIVTGISGQSEEKIRNFFNGVAEKEPAIIFIDELDSIAGKRENAQKDLEVRIVAQIASCMDELTQSEKQIAVIGCTSRPETIDSALRRAGRFERELTIGVPNEEDRIDILKILTSKMRLRETFIYEEMVKLTPGYVGADIQTLCKEASTIAVERIINGRPKDGNDEDIQDLDDIYIELDDFQKASKRV